MTSVSNQYEFTLYLDKERIGTYKCAEDTLRAINSFERESPYSLTVIYRYAESGVSFLCRFKKDKLWRIEKRVANKNVVYQFDEFGKLITMHRGLQSTARKLGIRYEALRQSIVRGTRCLMPDGSYCRFSRERAFGPLKVPHRKRVVCMYDTDGELLEKFSTISDAIDDAEKENTSRAEIVRSIRHKGNICSNGCVYLYEEDTFDRANLLTDNVAMIDSNGVIVASFASTFRAANVTGVPYLELIECLRGERDKALGHIWKYQSKFEYKNRRHGNITRTTTE